MNNTILDPVKIALFSAFQSILVSLISFVPTLLAAVLVFTIGWILGKWVKFGVIKLFQLLNLDDFVTSPSVKKFLQKAQVTQKIEVITGEVVRYLLVLVFFVAAINLLGLNTVTLVLNSLIAYLPNVFAAILILLLGILFAGFVEKIVKGSLGSIDIHISRLLAKITSYIIVTFTVLASLSQLRIAPEVIHILLIGFVSILDDWYTNFKKETKPR